MILNALDEILFCDDIDTLKTFTKQNSERFYPPSEPTEAVKGNGKSIAVLSR